MTAVVPGTAGEAIRDALAKLVALEMILTPSRSDLDLDEEEHRDSLATLIFSAAEDLRQAKRALACEREQAVAS